MLGTEPLVSWLRHRRYLNEHELNLMAVHFDYEGALAARQYGLAWNALEHVLHYSILIFTARRGAPVASTGGRAESIRLALSEIARWNPGCADRGWALALRPLDLSEDGVRQAFADVTAFAVDELGIDSAASRAAATRAWAESVNEIRVVGSLVGLANSDSWYLPDPNDDQGQATWFEQVMGQLEASVSEAVP
ncbi:hypothetical protein [Cellulomonas sp. URHB0016]